jgi:hypothetical protein
VCLRARRRRRTVVPRLRLTLSREREPERPLPQSDAWRPDTLPPERLLTTSHAITAAATITTTTPATTAPMSAPLREGLLVFDSEGHTTAAASQSRSRHSDRHLHGRRRKECQKPGCVGVARNPASSTNTTTRPSRTHRQPETTLCDQGVTSRRPCSWGQTPSRRRRWRPAVQWTAAAAATAAPDCAAHARHQLIRTASHLARVRSHAEHDVDNRLDTETPRQPTSGRRWACIFRGCHRHIAGNDGGQRRSYSLSKARLIEDPNGEIVAGERHLHLRRARATTGPHCSDHGYRSRTESAATVPYLDYPRNSGGCRWRH